MKKLFKSLSLIFALMGMIFIAGCGDGDDFEPIEEKVSGVAQDGYLCLADVSVGGEATSVGKTDMDGKFTDFSMNLGQDDYIVVKGGYDKDSWVTVGANGIKEVLSEDGVVLSNDGSTGYAKFRGVLKAPAPEDGDYSKVIISPVTNLIQQYKEDTGKSTTDAKNEIAEKLGVTIDLLKTDVITDDSDEALKIYKFNVILASAIKVATDVSGKEFESVAEEITRNIAKSDNLNSPTDIDTAIGASLEAATFFLNPEEKDKAKAVVREVSNEVNLVEKKNKKNIGNAVTVVENISADLVAGKDISDKDMKEKFEEAKKIKGFALKDNQFNGLPVSDKGELEGEIYASSMSFTVENYTNAPLSHKAKVTVKINSEQDGDKRSLELTIPVILKADSGEVKSTVSLEVVENAKINAKGTDSKGNIIKAFDLINLQKDELKGPDGSVEIPLETWVDRFESKISEDLKDFNLTGVFKVKLSIKAQSKLVFGYVEDGEITKEFEEVSGIISF